MSEPTPWRDVYLSIALLVAKGKSAPTTLTIPNHRVGSIHMGFDTAAQMERWAEAISLSERWADDTISYARGSLLGWYVLAFTETTDKAQPGDPELAAEVAAEVAAAIEQPGGAA
jgi:hypothetical protein